MSVPRCAKLVAPLREAAVQAAWTQWAALGYVLPSVNNRDGHAIVDPEALVLATLALRDYERRFEHVLWGWMDRTSRLLSASRITSLLKDYPAWMSERVARFAADAVAAGDPRWKKLAGKAQRTVQQPAGKGVPSSTTPLRQRTTLMLRLRLAFGVGIKADALTCLIARMGGRATIREIADDLGYFDRAVRRSVEDLAAAQLIDAEATSPVSYQVRAGPWFALLGLDRNEPPAWRHWRDLYAIVVRLDAWAAAADEASLSQYVAASRLRDTFDALDPLFLRSYVRERPDWAGPPEQWLTEFESWVSGFSHRLTATA